MRTASPLPYPGGKAALSDLLIRIRRLNGLGGRSIAEPFAGGAGASLTLLYLEETHAISINDRDRAVHAMWWSLLHETEAFLDLLQDAELSIREWRRQRDIYRSRRSVSRLRRGFAAFYLNRCNRSGIIMNGGPIGGIEQGGKWKLDARFNRASLVERCRRVREYGDRIKVSDQDGLTFIDDSDTSGTFLFVDPPYFGKGPLLYLNALDGAYHRQLAERLRELTDAAWLLTYDDCPDVRRMYCEWANIRPYRLRYSASERRGGRELVITPKWLRLPSHQDSRAIRWVGSN